MKSDVTTFILSTALVCTAMAGDPAPLASGGHSTDYEHLHFSNCGTPIVHSFNIEPAFTGRDLFATYRHRNGDVADEQEMELELEWGFTRTFGVIIEMAGIREDEQPGPTHKGWGDMAVVPRVLLHESGHFMLTGQVEIGLPTGNHGFGGDTAVAPGVNAWFDLGNWWTLNSQVAFEHAFDADSNELVFGFGLVKTIGSTDTHLHCAEGHDHRDMAGLFHLHFEVTGAMGLSGDEEGDTSMEGLIGLSYGLSSGLDLRCGYEFPLTSTEDFNHGMVAGVIWHF